MLLLNSRRIFLKYIINKGKKYNTAKREFKSVDEYIQQFPREIRDILENIRKVIRLAASGADEVMNYQIIGQLKDP